MSQGLITPQAIGLNNTTAPNKSLQLGGVDNSGNLQANCIKPLSTQVLGTDQGIVTHTVIHGLTTAGGGSYVDVKVNPSGALAVSATVTGCTTGTNSSVSDSASSVTILASNANRLGATISNDSSAALYLLLGSTSASTTNYSARITQYGYYEVPFGYTGQINGIWASDPNDGAARVTELT